MKESREVYVALAKEKFSEGYSKSENHVSGRLKGIKCTPNWQSDSKIKKDVERDYYMSADEALNYGLIDKII